MGKITPRGYQGFLGITMWLFRASGIWAHWPLSVAPLNAHRNNRRQGLGPDYTILDHFLSRVCSMFRVSDLEVFDFRSMGSNQHVLEEWEKHYPSVTLTRSLFATWVEPHSFIFLVSYSWSSFPGLIFAFCLSPFSFQR